MTFCNPHRKSIQRRGLTRSAGTCIALLLFFPGALASFAAQQAANPLPDEVRAEQIRDMKWGMFICWSFSTFSGREWTPTLDKDASYFKATGCDTDQWCRTAKDAGMGYILFLAKHHDGFCLWDTKTTEKKVTNSPLGIDVLAKLRKSCDKYGIKLALYFSEGDWNWPGAVDGKSNKPGGQDPELKKAQLKELLTQYGPIEFWWMDHAVGTGGLSHQDTVDWVHTFQPDSFVGFNHGAPAGRLCLREMGRPGKLGDASATRYNKDAESTHTGYLVAEFTYPILPKHKGGAMWFYSLPKHDHLCHPADKLYADYQGALKYGNIFSINIGPNYAGRIRDVDVATLKQVGAMIRKAGEEPRVRIDFRKQQDTGTVTSTGSGTRVSILSTTGIGAADLRRTGPSWPNPLTVHLKLKGLESLRMANGTLHFRTRLDGPKRVPYASIGSNPEDPSAVAGTLVLDLTRTQNGIRLVVPPRMTDGNPEVLSLEWIDFYRS